MPSRDAQIHPVLTSDVCGVIGLGIEQVVQRHVRLEEPVQDRQRLSGGAGSRTAYIRSMQVSADRTSATGGSWRFIDEQQPPNPMSERLDVPANSAWKILIRIVKVKAKA
ncbi:MAG: hypothetical protein BroJett003_00530 [Planctomycetota bacterium]|nr:MAG: hypothetical protein BroJett003_00530 [Planctomycetota bacterium]